MNRTHRIHLHLLAAAVALFAVSASQAASITKADYSAGKSRISADYKAAKAACSSMTSNAKDVCVEEAKAAEKVARAELEFGYTGKPADEVKVRVTRAETAYAVAKEKCDDQSGNAKDVCVKEAKAVEVKALAAARMVKVVGETRSDNAQDVRDADYKVATEKCDAMAGDAKTACISAAKTKFGKS
jgi:hypothetical protein